MRIAQTELTIRTTPREIREVTREVADWVARQGIERGVLTIFIPHTSASLLIQENYSPDVLRDLAGFLDRLAPEDPARFAITTKDRTICRPISKACLPKCS
jgi:secondary thiamine-phosphate synthase enzyme